MDKKVESEVLELPELPELDNTEPSQVLLEDILTEFAHVQDVPPEPEEENVPKKHPMRPLVLIAAIFALMLVAAAMIFTMTLREREDSEPDRSEETVQQTPEPSTKPSSYYIAHVETPGQESETPQLPETDPETETEPEEPDQEEPEVVEKTPLYWGIDVSEHQLEIDWKAVSLTGLDFAMIRVGYRGYTYGDIYEDEYFQANIQGATENGIKVGLYFFSQATTEEEAREEANYVLEAIGDYRIDYPIVYDWEYMSGDNSRTADVGYEQVTACARAFCQVIREAGYYPMIYFSQSAALLHFDLMELEEFDFWLADYSDAPWFVYDYQMWQYTASGQLDGITTQVDKNYCFKTYEYTPPAEPEVVVTFQPVEGKEESEP